MIEKITVDYKKLRYLFVFLKDPNIMSFNDGFKILRVTKYNYNRIFKSKDIFTYINYSTLNSYLLFRMLLNYKGDNNRIKEIVKLLNNNSSDKRLKILDSMLDDKYLFKIICKYYPDKISFQKDDNNFDYLNHIYVHAEKIFSESNFIKMLERSEKITTFSNDNTFVDLLNSGLIKGMVSKDSTVNEKKFGIELWMVNEINKSEFASKTKLLNEKSEWNILYQEVIKIMISDVNSDIFNFKRGTNSMKYQFIIFLANDCVGFINTSHIQLIENKKTDKIVKIEFDNSITKDNINSHFKKYPNKK
jgi:hypothetical protein